MPQHSNLVILITYFWHMLRTLQSITSFNPLPKYRLVSPPDHSTLLLACLIDISRVTHPKVSLGSFPQNLLHL